MTDLALGRLIGYARVSRLDQNPALQERALLEAGCVTIYRDKASGALTDRPGLDAALTELRAGDTLVVWKLDRLGRSLRDLVNRILSLEERKVGLRCLTQPLDTTTPGGRLIFHVFAAIAEYERELIRERSRAGLEAARAQGRLVGGPRALSDDQVAVARRLLEEGQPVRRVADLFHVSADTVYRRVGKPRRTP